MSKGKILKCDIMKGEYYYALGEDGQTYQIAGYPPKTDIVVEENIEGVGVTDWVQDKFDDGTWSRSEREERIFTPFKK